MFLLTFLFHERQQMKKLLLGILLILAVSACGISFPSRGRHASGHIISETREVSGFHGIVVSGGSVIDITQGEEEGLVIEADENMMEYLESEVEDGILYLGIRETQILDGFISFDPVHYHLKVKNLDDISISGSTDLTADSLTTTDMKVDLSGASTIKINDFQADSLDLVSSGASDVDLAGNCPRQIININGGGKYRAADLVSKDVTINASGAADVDVSAADKLELNLSGASQVDYYGDPTITQNISGASDVNGHPAK